MTQAFLAITPVSLKTAFSGNIATNAVEISSDPNRQGGDACIRNTRIPVWVLVNYRRLGGTDEVLLRDYPSLTTADLRAAWAYAVKHKDEIDAAIRENEE